MLKNIVLITLLIIALGGVAVLAYQQLAPTKEVETPETQTGNGEPGMIKTELEAPTAPEFSEIDTSDWLIYRNEEYGFELKYPPRFVGYARPYSIPSKVGGIAFRLPDHFSQPYSMDQPVGDGIPHFLPDYNFYARQYGPYPGRLLPCKAPQVASRVEVIIDDVGFIRTAVHNSSPSRAPGSGVSSITYTSKYMGVCYRFKFDRTLRWGESPEEALRSLPREIMDFEKIVSTWTIIDK